MEATARAVERLTAEHTVTVDGTVGYSGPLITELREARYPNLGRTKGGGGSGDVLDVKAITLYEHIDGTVRAWIDHYRKHAPEQLEDAILLLWETLQAEHAGGRLEDHERMYAMFPTWVEQIEDHFDPPAEYELTSPCPDCEAGRIEEDGGTKWAVRVPVKVGRAVIAECHACGRMWAGREDLTQLAEAMGVEVDWVKLRELETQAKETTPV